MRGFCEHCRPHLPQLPQESFPPVTLSKVILRCARLKLSSPNLFHDSNVIGYSSYSTRQLLTSNGPMEVCYSVSQTGKGEDLALRELPQPGHHCEHFPINTSLSSLPSENMCLSTVPLQLKNSGRGRPRFLHFFSMRLFVGSSATKTSILGNLLTKPIHLPLTSCFPYLLSVKSIHNCLKY